MNYFLNSCISSFLGGVGWVRKTPPHIDAQLPARHGQKGDPHQNKGEAAGGEKAATGPRVLRRRGHGSWAVRG